LGSGAPGVAAPVLPMALILEVSAGAVMLAESVALASGTVLPVALVLVELVSLVLQALRANRLAANRERVRRFILKSKAKMTA